MITGATRVVGVIGDPVRHSLSPVIHNAAFAARGLDWIGVAFEVVDGGAVDALAGMRALDLVGLSVTMPHKGAVAAAVDERSAEADALGAVNCVRWNGGRLRGENTDGAGFLDSLRLDEGIDPDGRRCVVLGAGGAARAVVLALAGAGASSVAVVNRTAARAGAAAELGGSVGTVATTDAVADADLVVNATPVGMGPGGSGDALVLDPDLLSSGQVVVDLVYEPAETPLLRAASARGARAVGGIGMLVHQAAHAFRHWTGETAPMEAMATAARRALAERAP